MQRSSKPGTRTSKSSDLRSNDPLDRLILEKGLRISDVAVANEAVVLRLNNGSVYAEPLSGIAALKDAPSKQLQQCTVFANGVGIVWPKLDVHLSLKGFLSNMVRNELIRRLTMEPAPRSARVRRSRKRVEA
jgi:hypothetical protein